MSSSEATEKILAAVKGVSGLRPAMPVSEEHAHWLPGDWEGLAVDLDPDGGHYRLKANPQPLPPLLERVCEAVRPVLAGTPWERANLRLVVTDIDGSAFSACTNE
ncbi:hypothetical protein [Amycolatopsis sp. H20-H5]|uniref:hypothetical protein n=1 Tax=Amycolatopsis sp. H20-H5 TaxID=3046309 RepID=UPI002DB83BC3|nr:hypothetical protein [Amycolatopsis sp. H20-H5]MEC3975640.1 hypothetical protein [Amycolatopsis sp. H20-H5]